MAPLPGVQAKAKSTPLLFRESWVTLGLPGAPGGVDGGAMLKVAVTAVAELTVSAHEPVPEQAPVQPPKVEPEAGVAVRVNAVPRVTDCEHVVPQLMPLGVLVTVPEPEPLFVTESVTGEGVAPRAGTGTELHDRPLWPAALTDFTQMYPVTAAPLA